MHHANQIVNKPPLFAAALLPVIDPDGDENSNLAKLLVAAGDI